MGRIGLLRGDVSCVYCLGNGHRLCGQSRQYSVAFLPFVVSTRWSPVFPTWSVTHLLDGRCQRFVLCTHRSTHLENHPIASPKIAPLMTEVPEKSDYRASARWGEGGAARLLFWQRPPRTFLPELTRQLRRTTFPNHFCPLFHANDSRSCKENFLRLAR